MNGLNVPKCSYYSAYDIYICKTHVLNVLCTMTFFQFVKLMLARRAGTYASLKYAMMTTTFTILVYTFSMLSIFIVIPSP